MRRDLPPPQSKSASPTPDNGSSFHSHFPLPGAAAEREGCPRRCTKPRAAPWPPTTSGSRHQPEFCGCLVPLPDSGIALALGPIPPISRSAGPSQLGFGAPCPVPGPGRRKAAEEGGLSTNPRRGWGGGGGSLRVPDRELQGPRARRRANGGKGGEGVDRSCGGGRERGKGEAPGGGKKGGRAGLRSAPCRGRGARGRGAARGSSHFLAPLALAVQLPLQALRAVLRLVRLLLQRLDLAFHRLQGVEAGHGKEARGRTQRALHLARIGSGEAAAAAPQPPSLCLRRCRPRSSLPQARPPSGR